MRRVHPQRAKPSAQSSNTNNNPSSGGADKTNVNHEVKAWTTHSELHKRYTTDNSNTTLDQAVSHARLSSISNSSATNTAKKPFMFSSSSMMRHSQEHESDATNLRQNGKLSLASRSKDKDKSDSGDGGTGDQDRGRVGNRPSIVIGNDDDDDDDDFELPSIDELFTDVLPRKFRRVDSSTDSDTTSDRTHTHQAQIKDKTPLHNHSHSDMRKGKQAAASEDDQWLMSELQVNENIDLFSPSPSSENDNQPIQKMPSTMSTRSVVSQTRHTLNEIDQLFMDESLTRSPSTRLQTPFGDQGLSEQGSSTLHVRATGIYSPDQDMNEPGADEVVLFEDLPPEDPDVTIGGDSQVLGQRRAGEKVHDEPRDELGVGQGATVGDEQATSTIEQATEESGSRKQTQTFTLPHSSDAFRDRLTKLRSIFQSSMDEMMDAILYVVKG
ncbi:hypothetical protein KI688_000093 [Linnemannia hyalina]|uniref:Uncharacterized protein n=1 Tax=Linnemannia hyalina TaxID=64524 RepID=A0A9P8BYD3_9FUNG|nr:hypothetical protein KI688_000093 [Linnemannia hyalina]